MDQVLDFFRKLFDTSDWPPRWHCGEWSEFHGWLYIISDLLIWSAYFAIPLVILRFISRRGNARFSRTYFLFAAFILACGSTHLLDAVIFWFPAYRLSALLRFFTGLISWATVFHVVRLLPTALRMKTAEELEREIRERERAEEQLRITVNQLNEAQEIARMGHWQWDVAGDNVSWSQGLYRVYGLPPSENGLSYDQYLEKVHPEDRDFVSASIRAAFDERRFSSFTHRIILPDGSVKIIQAKGEVLLDAGGAVSSMIGTAQDITEQFEAQQALRLKSAQLEASNLELQKYAYVASHDLQEPLRKILTFISLMQKEPGMVSPEGAVYFQKVSDAAERMQRLIDDILRFSNLQRDDAGFVDVALDAVLQNVLQDLEVSIAQSGAQVRVDPLPVLRGLPSQLGQLFQNLLRNAMKFSRPGLPPVVTVTCREIGSTELPEDIRQQVLQSGVPAVRTQWARIEVRDNGIGFDPAYSEKIFEVFQRLHSAKTYQGTGIGLAIVKKIVDFHNGFIRAEGKPDAGAVFTVFLPLNK